MVIRDLIQLPSHVPDPTYGRVSRQQMIPELVLSVVLSRVQALQNHYRKCQSTRNPLLVRVHVFKS